MPEGLKMQTSATVTKLRPAAGLCYADLAADAARLRATVAAMREEYLLVHDQLAALRSNRARELWLVGGVALAVGLVAWPVAILFLWSLPL
jgi:hypothetical protein